MMEKFPEVKIIVDAKEQPCRRPGNWDEQKPYYSGKKKRHTLKTQIVCRPSGRIGAVSRSAAGCVHDLKVLRYTKVLDNLESGEGALLDKGYVGIEEEHPRLIDRDPEEEAAGRRVDKNMNELCNRRISRSRVVVEHVMAQLNQYGVLKQVFRSVHGRHDRVIRVVAMVVDRRIAEQPLKSGVAEVAGKAEAA